MGIAGREPGEPQSDYAAAIHEGLVILTDDICCISEDPCCFCTCCNGQCCNGTCCGSRCCTYNCCGARCCIGAYCSGVPGGCWPSTLPKCCGTHCCLMTQTCCPSGCCNPGQMCCGDGCCDSADQCCNGQCCPTGQTCCNGQCGPKGRCCFFATGACSELTSACCTEQGGTYHGDGTSCLFSDICRPVCENCHAINETFNECDHAMSGPCYTETCIRNTINTVGCDYFWYRYGPPECNTSLWENVVYVTQELILLDNMSCAPTNPGGFHVWIVLHAGCGPQ